MKIWKIIGKIGAGALGLGGLILAGKSGFGETLLKFGSSDEDDFVDDCDVCGEVEIYPEGETPEEVTETNEEEVPE